VPSSPTVLAAGQLDALARHDLMAADPVPAGLWALPKHILERVAGLLRCVPFRPCVWINPLTIVSEVGKWARKPDLSHFVRPESAIRPVTRPRKCR
jgi:hypothetical protein